MRDSTRPVVPQIVQNSSAYRAYLERIKGKILDEYYAGTKLQDADLSSTWFCYSAAGVEYGVSSSGDFFKQYFPHEELFLFTVDATRGEHVLPTTPKQEDQSSLPVDDLVSLR